MNAVAFRNVTSDYVELMKSTLVVETSGANTWALIAPRQRRRNNQK